MNNIIIAYKPFDLNDSDVKSLIDWDNDKTFLPYNKYCDIYRFKDVGGYSLSYVTCNDLYFDEVIKASKKNQDSGNAFIDFNDEFINFIASCYKNEDQKLILLHNGAFENLSFKQVTDNSNYPSKWKIVDKFNDRIGSCYFILFAGGQRIKEINSNGEEMLNINIQYNPISHLINFDGEFLNSSQGVKASEDRLLEVLSDIWKKFMVPQETRKG